MKMAKKVLSVVLAVVMALSCFAVAGSAFGPSEGATHHAAVKLLAAVGTSTITTPKKVNFTDPEVDFSSSVTAKVGDTVYIYVYGGTDYYVHSFCADVFYPAVFKTPTDVLDGLKAGSTFADDIKQTIFFGKSDLIKTYGFSSTMTTLNEWYKLTSDAKNDVAKAWPTDADGNIIDGFHAKDDNTTPSADWKFMRFAEIISSPSVDHPVKMNINDEYTFRLPLYIPEGTPAGTYTVTIPEAAAGKKEKPTGFTRVLELGGCTYDEDWEMWDIPQASVDTAATVVDTTGTWQSFDFSQSTVTITIKGEEEELSWDALASAYAAAPKNNNDGTYTAASWTASGIETALANAAAELNETTGHKCTTQDDIDALETAIGTAVEALKVKADYTALNDAIAAGDEVVTKQADYDTTLATWTTFTTNLAAAKNVSKDLANTDANKATIANAAKAVTDAIEALTLLKANYTEYDKAVSAANTALTKTTWYSAASLSTLSGVMTTYGNLSKDLLKKDQATVDTATGAINGAVGALVEVKATEYEDLADLIGTYMWQMTNGQLKETDYTEVSWGIFADALANADKFMKETDYTQKHEDENGDVAVTIAVLTSAYEDLAEAGDADYEALYEVIADFYELEEDAYTVDSWNAVDEYIEYDIDFTLNENFQDTIDDEYIPTLQGLIEDLVFEEFDITYNYYVGQTAMAEELVAKVANSNETTYTYEDDVVISKAKISLDGYTCESVSNEGWGAETEIGDKTVNVVFSKNEAAQHNITYTYVDEAQNPVAATTTNPTTFKEDQSVTIDPAKFTAESSNYEFKSVNPTTIAEGTTTDVDVTVTFKLKDADYSALDDAIKAAEAKKEYQYTAESWAPFATALVSAKNINRTLKITSQSTIDTAKDLLIAKMNALVIAVNGSVYEVNYTPVKAQLSNTFEIKVDGRAMMIQFQELSHGQGTRSYDRYSENVSIVSYDKDGNIVPDYSKDLAYEVWTVTTRIDGPEMGIRVKNNGSSKWETPDKAYKFTYEKVEVKADIISAELTATSGPQGGVAATVVAGPDAERVQFKMEDGSTVTMYASKATTDKDGNLVFTGRAFMNHAGLNTITIRVLADNKWTTSETTLTYTADAAK